MIIKNECYWCFVGYEKKSVKSTRQRFCSRKCLLAHWRARNAEKLRKYQAKYRKNNATKIRLHKRNWNEKNVDYRRLWYLANSNVVKTTQLVGYRKEMRSRQQAKRIVKKLGWERKCLECGTINNVHLHHIDGNSMNNKTTNLIYLCKKHHGIAHVRMNVIHTSDTTNSPI
jgi:hypothetical protein